MRQGIAAVIFALSSLACAHADTAARMAQQLALYEKYAGAPVERFPMINLWQWQVVGKEKVVVWTMVNKAYLITVYKPCIDLDWTPAIGITQNSSMHVDAKFDAIVFDHQHCRIQEIRPIDYKALRAEEKAARDAKAQDSGGE